MASSLPSLHSIEKSVLAKSINDREFFLDFVDHFGDYTFHTNIRNILFGILKRSKDGTDLSRLVLRRKGAEYYRKLVRVYRSFKTKQILASGESLLGEFRNAVRTNKNVLVIRRYLNEVKKGDYKNADKVVSGGFESYDDGILDELEVGDNIGKVLKKLSGAEESERLGRFGFKILDRVTGGIWAGDFIIIFGRPGVGKSIFLLNIAHKNRIRGKSVVIITLEMTPERVRRRYMSRVSRLDYKRCFKRGKLGKGERSRIKRMMNSSGSLGGKLFLVGVKGDCSLGMLNSIVRKYRDRHGVEIFGVDFIDCVNSGGRSWSEQNELGKVAQGLKNICLDHDVGIVGISHMNMAREDVEDEGRLTQRDMGYSQRKNQFSDISLGMIQTSRDEEEGLITFQAVKMRDAESELYFKLRPNLDKMIFEDI